MKKLIVLFAALGSAIAFAAAPKASNPKEVISSFEDAFNKHDASQLGQLFANDATLIMPDGKAFHGQAKIQQELNRQLGTNFKDAKSKLRLEGQRPIGANAIWVDVTHQASNLLLPSGQHGDQKWHVVMLLEKQGDQWKAEEVRPYALTPPSQLGTGGAGQK